MQDSFQLIEAVEQKLIIMSNFEYVFNKQDEKTAKQLYDEHRHELPMLVVVATGFYGNREEITFSTGQVRQLSPLRRERGAAVCR